MFVYNILIWCTVFMFERTKLDLIRKKLQIRTHSVSQIKSYLRPTYCNVLMSNIIKIFTKTKKDRIKISQTKFYVPTYCAFT
jgi:hypothetical protein